MALNAVKQGTAKAGCLLRGNAAVLSQVRGIVSKEFRDPNYKRPAPFPYETKNYSLLRSIFDDTTHRFNENTKIITVEGPPTGNKEKFCRYLAEKLEMKYIPDGHINDWYIDEYGVDLRCLNPKVPPSMRTLDIHQWLQRPNHPHAARLQQEMMMSRWSRYFDAHNHLFNTGEGVVCHRSIYSDRAWAQTLVDMGWMTKAAQDYMETQKRDSCYEFLRPHLVIYLDMEPQTIIDNANKRAEAGEVNSPVFTPEVLERLIKNYQDHVIKPLSVHAEVLVYDWNQGDGDYDAIIEDICDIDFDCYTKYQEKMNDWNLFRREANWKAKRGAFNRHHGRQLKMQLQMVPPRDIPELFPPPNDVEQYTMEKAKLPSQMYAPGYNAHMGDKVGFFS